MRPWGLQLYLLDERDDVPLLAKAGTVTHLVHDAPHPSPATALAGRPLEHEFLTGAVVRAAQRLAVDAPLNRAMLALLGAVSGRPAG